MTFKTAAKRASAWALSRSTAPPALGKAQSVFIVVAMSLAIGAADYASGIRISLAVFYLVPILLATAWFEWELASFLAVACVALRLLGDFEAGGRQPLPVWIWWNSISSVLVFLFVVWIFGNLLSLYRQMSRRVDERTEELLAAAEHRRRLEHELLTLSSKERNDIGQELHDDICQHLVATSLAAKVLAQRLEQHRSDLGREAQAIIALIEQGTAKTRQLAQGLLLSSIPPEQLAERLDELAEEGSRSGVACTFRQTGRPEIADADTAAQLYRIAQEAMRNAIKHAHATNVEICLAQDRDAISLIVEDDGDGMQGGEATSGLGLGIMANRAAYIGATMAWTPSPRHGTRVVCALPLAPT